MQKNNDDQSKKFFLTVLFGAISISAYIMLFIKETLVTDYFTKGNWYAILPIGTAFLFSFVHGAFTGNLLSVLGLEAKKK